MNRARQTRTTQCRDLYRFAAAALCVLTLWIIGCEQRVAMPAMGGSGGTATVSSEQPDGVLLLSKFDRGWYITENRDTVVALLTAGPEDAPTEVMTIRMFFTPRAGRTPVSAQAVNARFVYVLFSNDEAENQRMVGVYSGGGFVYPQQFPGPDMIRIGTWDSTLTLSDASEGFVDLLGRTRITGTFNVARSGALLDKIRHLNVRVSQELGYPRLVLDILQPMDNASQLARAFRSDMND